MLEYRSEHSSVWETVLITPEQILSQSGKVIYRLCNLSHRTLYWVRVAESNVHIIHPLDTQYSFTTNDEPMVKLAMASASTASLATLSTIVVCLNSLWYLKSSDKLNIHSENKTSSTFDNHHHVVQYRQWLIIFLLCCYVYNWNKCSEISDFKAIFWFSFLHFLILLYVCFYTTCLTQGYMQRH